MPFCTQCGTQCGDQDVFCHCCGERQGASAAGAKPGSGKAGGQDFLSGLTPRNASILCYVPFIGWIASIVFLAADRFREDREVRFHSFQGLYLYAVYIFVDWFLLPLFDFNDGTRWIARMMKVSIFGTWIFMLVQASQGRTFRLPFLGELADRSMSEQK
jgi:uncharacterized membrane protein